MNKENVSRGGSLEQDALEQVSGGIQAGSQMTKPWVLDEFGNEIHTYRGTVTVYRPDGTDITPGKEQKTTKKVMPFL